MARKIHLENHYQPQELKEKYLKTKDLVESRRWHLLWKISLGWTVKESAMFVGISYSYARKIVKNYNQKGQEGIKNQKNKSLKYRGGKKALLNEKQINLLMEVLCQRPSDGGIWTGPKVSRWIEKETGRQKVFNQRGWDYLKKCGYSWQMPRPKHRKGCEIQQQEFKKNLPLKVKKLQQSNPDRKIEVWFFDEHRVGLKPILRKVWAKVGNRPIATVQHRYEWVYVYGFVNPKTGETLWYLIPRVNTLWLNRVYEQFAIDVGISEDKKVLLMEDNAGWHSSHKVKIPSGIIVDYLPPYSPELQPAERLWTLVDEPLINEHFETIEEIENILEIRCNFLRREMKEEIKNLTNYHWLTYG
jgi:transposase